MLDILLNFDKALPAFFANYGAWVYAVVFGIIFCETGLVVTPILPGDSMLFAMGAFAAQGSLEIGTLAGLLVIAAVAGDSLNYLIGKYLGHAILNNPHQKLFKPEHYQKAHAFYAKWGGKAIVLSRFIPIVRTFAPFVAGIGHMHYRKFVVYNIAGGVAWVALFLGMGYGLGNLTWVKGNFKLIALAIIILSLLPVAWEVVHAHMKSSVTPISKTNVAASTIQSSEQAPATVDR
jgi:membrane-associated protein